MRCGSRIDVSGGCQVKGPHGVVLTAGVSNGGVEGVENHGLDGSRVCADQGERAALRCRCRGGELAALGSESGGEEC